MESPYLTIDEAAEYCKLSKRTIYNNRRYIAKAANTRKLLFTRESLDNFLTKKRKKCKNSVDTIPNTL